MPRIPLIEDLTTGPIPPSSYLLVEFDSASQWYNASITIAAGWLRTGGMVRYTAMAQPTEVVRRKLSNLGINVKELEATEARRTSIRSGFSRPILSIYDGYTVTLGQKSDEKLAIGSLKVADVSIEYSKSFKRLQEWGRDTQGTRDLLGISDNESVMARFNDEKAWVEFELTREITGVRLGKMIELEGILKGVHSDWAYKQLESAADGVIDFKLEETGKRAEKLIRIRFMRNVPYDSEWHSLKVDENFEVFLDK